MTMKERLGASLAWGGGGGGGSFSDSPAITDVSIYEYFTIFLIIFFLYTNISGEENGEKNFVRNDSKSSPTRGAGRRSLQPVSCFASSAAY
jgi:hypothetical protein